MWIISRAKCNEYKIFIMEKKLEDCIEFYKKWIGTCSVAIMQILFSIAFLI